MSLLQIPNKLRLSPLKPSCLLRSLSTRPASTPITPHKITPHNEQSLLVAQRKLRPMSPHLTVYKKQLTFNLSGAHRIFGVCMAGTLYGSLIAYGMLPLIGYPITVSQGVELWSQAPHLLKLSVKTIMALPFAFHMYNGVRHLIWDTGRALSLKNVYRTGYLVLALAGATTLYLAFD